MALAHSPRIVTDGLAFAIDNKNSRSFKGHPGNNYLETTTWGQGASMGRSDERPVSGASHSSLALVTPDPATGIPNPPVAGHAVWKVTDSNPDNFSRFSPWSGFTIDDLPELDVDYVGSCYIWIPSTITLGNSDVHSVQQNTTGTDWHGGPIGTATYNATYDFWASNILQSEQRIDRSKRGQWQRIWAVFRPSTAIRNQESGSGITINRLGGYLRPNLIGQDGSNYFYVSCSQLEKGSYPSPFNDGTRSATSSVFNLVGNEDVNVTESGLTYNDDGTYGFKGNISPIFSTVARSPSEVTISVWTKITTHGSFHRLVNNNWVGDGWLLYTTSANWTWGKAVSGTQYNLYSAHNNTSDWAMVTGTYNNSTSTMKLYVNGVLKATNSSVPSHTMTTSGVVNIAHTNPSDLQIPIVHMYNRALSDAEVLQNFNATKQRFGL